MKNIIKDKRGLTLIELLVSIAVLSIMASFLIVSYTSALEDQRQQADLAMLENIDMGFKQLYLYDDAFEEAKPIVHDKNMLTFTFPTVIEDDVTSVDVAACRVNGHSLATTCPKTYAYLLEYVGSNKIKLESSTFKYGYYQIVVEFNYAHVSDLRKETINNDSIKVTNSAGEYFRQTG